MVRSIREWYKWTKTKTGRADVSKAKQQRRCSGKCSKLKSRKKFQFTITSYLNSINQPILWQKIYHHRLLKEVYGKYIPSFFEQMNNKLATYQADGALLLAHHSPPQPTLMLLLAHHSPPWCATRASILLNYKVHQPQLHNSISPVPCTASIVELTVPYIPYRTYHSYAARELYWSWVVLSP